MCDSSRKGPVTGSIQQHQEVQYLSKVSKRMSRDAGQRDVKKRRKTAAGGSPEDRNPGQVVLISKEDRWKEQRILESGTKTKAGLKTGAVQYGPEVRRAQIRKTRIQSGYKLNRDQSRPIRGRTESRSEVTSWSTAGPLRNRVPLSEAGITIRRSEKVLGSSQREGKTRRKTRVPPSVFSGRGQLWLSITPEAGHLIIHIGAARGLMGASERSCDSYVQLAVTCDLDCSIMMTSKTILNKKPEYNCKCTLRVNDELLLHRLLFSVFRSSCQLIGCMSFGIASLFSPSKVVTGWFHLLNQEFGRSKHLRVTPQPNMPKRRLGDEKTQISHADIRKTPDVSPAADLNSAGATSSNSLPKPTSTTAAGPNRTKVQSPVQSPALVGVNHQRLHGDSNCSSFGTALNTAASQEAVRRSTHWLLINIVRGKDGFGFTICSDSPVKVQAVDTGGPAHQSGLCQGDVVLQLNGLPVETWKCIDLAHAIRSCPSRIVLVVWRCLPELRSACEPMPTPQPHNRTTDTKLKSHSLKSKDGPRRGRGSRFQSSFDALGSLWRVLKKEVCEEDQEVSDFSWVTQVTSSAGDNYIILSPVNTGGQVQPPVYQDRNTTVGHLYQTLPCRGQNLLQEPQVGLLAHSLIGQTSTLPPTVSSASPSSYGNYQNCTIVQSHRLSTSFGAHCTLAPKTLIFPVFVQPLDLCTPERTLLMAEEMVLHQPDLLPAEVTVLIYSDLLLFTREDEAGRYNVLQTPQYLNTLQLKEVPTEPCLLHFWQRSADFCCCLFSLEALSIDQKVRVSLCLHDNSQLQVVPTEMGFINQLTDFDILSPHEPPLFYHCSTSSSSVHPSLMPPSSTLCDPLRSSSFALSSLIPPLPSSTPPLSSLSLSNPFQAPPPLPLPSTTAKSPVWKKRGGTDEAVEESQQGEGESASETLESVAGVRGHDIQLGPAHCIMKEDGEKSNEEGGATGEQVPFRAEGLRRSRSEGFLLLEPQSPRFLSDSTIHRLIQPTLDLKTVSCRPSIQTLRKQLTQDGGSLNQMLLFLNGTKSSDVRRLHLKKKTKNLAADVRSCLPFLQPQKSNAGVHGNSLEKALRNNRPSLKEVLRWAESLEALLTNQYGVTVFRHFLRSEFSEENLDFWLAVERFKQTRSICKMAARAKKIYDEFVSTSAARQVNMDSSVRETTLQSLRLGVSPASFQLAQDRIFTLMETDSYPRFLKSRLYIQLAKQDVQATTK